MIGRRSAMAIAESYFMKFTYVSTTRGFSYYADAFYDFLYVNDFEGWLLNAVKTIGSHKRRGVLEFILKLHTGESQAAATQGWSWDERKRLGQRFLYALAQAMLFERHNDPEFEPFGDAIRKTVDRMQAQLELDGYVFKDGVLLVPEESALDEPREKGVLEELVKEVSLPNAALIEDSLKLSEDSYEEGRWDESLAASRAVLESVLGQIAGLHSRGAGAALDADALSRPERVREYLEESGLLDHSEAKAIASVYELLGQTEAHPHIEPRDWARLVRHLALTLSQFVLLRFKSLSASSS